MELFRRCRQLVCGTPCDLTTVQEELQADVPDIDAIALMNWFANHFDAATQALDLVSIFPVDSRCEPPKGVP